jgi:hypothetical protein
MKDDILPPRQAKINMHKKPAADNKPKPTIIKPASIADVPPMVMAEAVKTAKKISLGNIKQNYRPKHWYNLNKEEQWVLLAGLTITMAALFGGMYFWFMKPPATVAVASVPTVKKAPSPITVPAPLTGLPIDPGLAHRPVTGIMIENSPDARPQSGLQDAGVIYEAIAEGGITRFIALFQDTRPQYIGPVRSLRPYYIDWAVPWDAGIAHVGGSPEALAQIRSGMKDLDQFFNAGSYWRQPTRVAPHNVYTSFDRMDGLNVSKGYTTSNPVGWEHKSDQALKVPTAKSINISISSALFNAHFDYDAASNAYLRSEGGRPHIVTTSPDDAAGQQLHPKVVITLIIPYRIIDSAGHSGYASTGSGPGFIFQDGGVTALTWSKTDRPGQFSFKDAAGQNIKLDAGQTWVTVVGGANQISYSP